MGNLFTTFTNCRLCINGKILEGERLVVSQDSGLILEGTGYIGGEIIDLDNDIIAPGFLELHTNGANGFHYIDCFNGDEKYHSQLQDMASYYPSKGVTGFWATLPTVESSIYPKLLPKLKPFAFPAAAALLGVHVEGPYLHGSKAGAHDSNLFLNSEHPIASTFGFTPDASNNIIKLATIAPDIACCEGIIKSFADRDIRVSLGHSSATFEQGLSGLKAGATCLTHAMNCMAPFHHRNPGLAGLICLPSTSVISPLARLSSVPPPPYYTILCDGIHLHSSVASMLFRANPDRVILISDSIELLGLPDGLYPGNHQIGISKHQRKLGNRVTFEGTNTLVGSCTTLAEGVKNIMNWAGCDVAQAVKAVTENIVELMGIQDRGKLETGRRADFVVMDDRGDVKETWIAGEKIWEKPLG